MAPPELSAVQQAVVDDIVKHKKNVLIIGGPGTGKTFTLNRALDILDGDKSKNRRHVFRLCPTKIAAIPIGGVTLDWFLCHWKNVDNLQSFQVTLVIEEISMVTYKKFAELSNLMSLNMCNPSPFGGVQIVICGDFRQLPPPERAPDGSPARFCCFDPTGPIDHFNRLWSKVFPVDASRNSRVHILTDIIRQKDYEYSSIVNAIGQCRVTLDMIERINATDGADPDAVRLFPLNVQVDAFNKKSLALLEGPERVFRPKIIKGPQHFSDLTTVSFKVGSRVMCTSNKIEGIANGSRGTVVCLHPVRVLFDGMEEPLEISRQEYKVYSATGSGSRKRSWGGQMKDKAVAGGGKQKSMAIVGQAEHIPLTLAHAITINKSQSLTLDTYEVDLDKCFAHGMAYVAISRGTSLDRVTIKNFRPEHVRHNPSADFIYSQYQKYK